MSRRNPPKTGARYRQIISLLPYLMTGVMAVGALSCTTTQGGSAANNGANPSGSVSTAQTELLMTFKGNPTLRSEMEKAIASKGADYVPRTKHRAGNKPKYTNRLIFESSPYLLQHAHNPVNWFPWGDEAFELAKKLGRPIFLSVGYSTCHWCHVMEEESFEDEAIATYMNDHYVAIKVDREERPDVDSIYMRAVQRLTGRGGWPMSVWLTHDRKPFYGGTYFPARDGDRGTRKGFLTILGEQDTAFQKNPDTVANDATRLAQRVAQDLTPPAAGGMVDSRAIIKSVSMATRRYDSVNGGSQGSPKFPSNFPTRLLLRHGRRAGGNSNAMAMFTLKKMAAGGMYDHVGGGFHRYSTDKKWLVPHYEKMLYDNAMLAVAYLEAYQVSQDANLSRVAADILDYVARDLQLKGGGFASATDADSVGPKGHREEGYYFTWTPAELASLLTEEEVSLVTSYYGVTPRGNFEGRNIFFTTQSRDEAAAALKLTATEFEDRLASARDKLLKARQKRPSPLRDDKLQVSWNGLMIGAMARGGFVLGEPRHIQSAARAAERILKAQFIKGRLRHSSLGSQVSKYGFAEDYIFLSQGLLQLYAATQEQRWLKHAVELMNALEEHHANKASGGYFRTASDHEKLITREIELQDHAVPSAGSIAALVHLQLHALTTDDVWRQRGELTFRSASSMLGQAPWALDTMLLAVDFLTERSREVVVVYEDGNADETQAMLNVLRSTFAPHVVYSHGTAEALGKMSLVPGAKDKPARDGLATAYVCEQGACKLPTTSPAALRKQLLEVMTYDGSPATKAAPTK